VPPPDDMERTVELADAMMRALDALERLSDAVTHVSSAMADGEQADYEKARDALEAMRRARADADAALLDAQAAADCAVDVLMKRRGFKEARVTGVITLVSRKVTSEG
jgi:hypothetical protein